MKTSRSKVIIFLIVILLTLAGSTSIYFTIIKFRSIPFPWDSAGHAYEGLKIAQDLKAGDIISFFADTYRQAFWPFFHSWLLAPAFILFGNTYAVARSVSLICFIIFILLIYLIGNEMSIKRGHWIGFIAAFLALTSLPMLVLSSMCMSEMPGLMMTFISLLFYLKAIKHQKPYLFVFTSIFMALTVFTKWHHGIFVIPAVFLTQLTTKKSILCRSNYYLFCPFFILMLCWFIYPRHILSFYEHSTFQPHFYQLFSSENWLFYPKSFLHVYHSSVFFAIPITISFFYSLKRIKDPQILLFVIQILIGVILLTLKLDNRHRYIISIVPSIWILAASGLVNFGHYFQTHVKRRKIRITGTVIVILGILVISFSSLLRVYGQYPDSLLKYNFYGDEKTGKAYEYISENVGNHHNIAVFGSWDYYNSIKSSTIRWNIEVGRGSDLTGMKEKKEKAYYYFRRLLRNRDKVSYDAFIDFLENKDLTIQEYHLLSFMKMIDDEIYGNYRLKTAINPFSDKIIDVNQLGGSVGSLIIIYNEKEKEVNYFAEEFLAGQNQWVEHRRRSFPGLGITIAIYERNQDPKSIPANLSLALDLALSSQVFGHSTMLSEIAGAFEKGNNEVS